MKNARLALLAAVLLGATVCSPVHTSNTSAMDAKASTDAEKKKLVASIERKTIALVEEADGDVSPYCSGVWVGPEEIMTAFHCIQYEAKNGAVAYKTYDDIEAAARVAKVVGFDDDNDLALLHVDPKTMPTHSIAEISQDAWDGQHVSIVGHTTGMWWTYIEGVVSSTRVRDDSRGRPRLMLQISSPAWFGNSGGGAWDDQGRLMGISSFISTRAPLMTFFVHHEHIKQLLSKSLR